LRQRRRAAVRHRAWRGQHDRQLHGERSLLLRQHDGLVQQRTRLRRDGELRDGLQRRRPMYPVLRSWLGRREVAWAKHGQPGAGLPLATANMTNRGPSHTSPTIQALRAPARLAVAFIAVVVASPYARAESPTDEAEGLIRQGIELRHQHQDARALPLFERAY